MSNYSLRKLNPLLFQKHVQMPHLVMATPRCNLNFKCACRTVNGLHSKWSSASRATSLAVDSCETCIGSIHWLFCDLLTLKRIDYHNLTHSMNFLFGISALNQCSVNRAWVFDMSGAAQLKCCSTDFSHEDQLIRIILNSWKQLYNVLCGSGGALSLMTLLKWSRITF